MRPVTTASVTANIAPWIGLIGSTVAVAGASLRIRSGSRLRAALQADAELYAVMPDGPAKEALAATLEHEAEMLRDRVKHGYALSGGQLTALVGAGMAAYALLFAALRGITRYGWLGGHPEHGWTDRPMDVGLAIVASIGAVLLGVGSARIFMGWLDAKIQWADVNLDGLLAGVSRCGRATGRVLRRLRRRGPLAASETVPAASEAEEPHA